MRNGGQAKLSMPSKESIPYKFEMIRIMDELGKIRSVAMFVIVSICGN